MAPKDAYEKAPLHKSHSNYGFIEPIKYFVPSIGISQILKAEEGFKNQIIIIIFLHQWVMLIELMRLVYIK